MTSTSHTKVRGDTVGAHTKTPDRLTGPSHGCTTSRWSPLRALCDCGRNGGQSPSGLLFDNPTYRGGGRIGPGPQRVVVTGGGKQYPPRSRGQSGKVGLDKRPSVVTHRCRVRRRERKGVGDSVDRPTREVGVRGRERTPVETALVPEGRSRSSTRQRRRGRKAPVDRPSHPR